MFPNVHNLKCRLTHTFMPFVFVEGKQKKATFHSQGIIPKALLQLLCLKQKAALFCSVWTEMGCIPGLYLVVCGRRAELNLRKYCPSALVVRGRAEFTTMQWQVLTVFSLVVVFQSWG